MEAAKLTIEEQQFHEMFFDEGGLFAPESLLTDRDRTIIRNNKVLLGWRANTPPINFNIIADETINAIADKKDGIYYIGLNWGLIEIFTALFNRLMCHGSILSGIGDVSLEIAPAKTSKPFLETFAELISAYPHGIYIPKSQERRDLAVFLTEVAIHAITYHEFTHLRFGHCDFMHGINGRFRMSECDLDLPSQMDFLAIQYLEFDADNGMVRLLMGFYYSRMKSGNYPPQYALFFSSIKRLTKLIYFAIATAFKLLAGDTPFDVTQMESDYHPPAPVRQIMIHDTFIKMFEEKLLPGNPVEISQILGTASLELQMAFSIFSGVTLENGLDHMDYLSEINGHITKVLGLEKYIRPILKKHSID